MIKIVNTEYINTIRIQFVYSHKVKRKILVTLVFCFQWKNILCYICVEKAFSLLFFPVAALRRNIEQNKAISEHGNYGPIPVHSGSLSPRSSLLVNNHGSFKAADWEDLHYTCALLSWVPR